MYSFLLKRQPPTFNSWKKASKQKKSAYKTEIDASLRNYNTIKNKLDGELYGTVFHFYSKNLKIDADNLSKPLWDCLSDVLYDDDFQIKVRLTGSFDLAQNDFNILNFSGLSGKIIEQLFEAIENEEHVIYVECGKLSYSMFRFNLESYGD